MLSLAGLPRDPVFPGLRAALHADSAARAFGSALAAVGTEVRSLTCTVERCRIKRGRKALIGYRLRGRSVDGNAIDQRAMLALYPECDPTLLPDMAEGATLVPSQLGPGSLSIPSLAGRVWFFPNDRKVHGIARMLAERPGEIEIMHYVPEQGCTVRLREGSGRVLYGKCRADDRGEVAAKFGSERYADFATLRLANVVAYDRANRIFWQDAVAGNPLDAAAVLAEPDLWASRIGEALAQFHALPAPPGLKKLTFTSTSETICRRIARTGEALPEHATRLSAIAKELELSRPAEADLAPAHGDLHPANLLWDGTSFGLIDLDTAALAPRAFDYATLGAALTQKAIEAGVNDAAITACVQALRQSSRREAIDPAQFDWAYAASLLGERLYRCATRLKGGTAENRLRLLDRAEQVVACHA